MWVVKGYTRDCYDTYLVYESDPFDNEKDAEDHADNFWFGDFSDFAVVEEVK